jgi:hypothetical protein
VVSCGGHIDEIVTRNLRAQNSYTVVIVFQEGKGSQLPQTACFHHQLAYANLTISILLYNTLNNNSYLSTCVCTETCRYLEESENNNNNYFCDAT